jgi:hypothetical protein
MAPQKALEHQDVTNRAPATPARILDAKWDGKSSFTLPEVGKIIGISTWTAYQQAKPGGALSDIVIQIGRRKIATRVGLERKLMGG